MNVSGEAPLLVELFTEELPPKELKRLGEEFGARVQNGLMTAQLKTRDSIGAQFFATPRRLAVLIPDVLPKAADRTASKRLMPSKIAYDADGKPTPALIKRLEKEAASANLLTRKIEESVEYVYLNQSIPGITLQAGLQTALNEAIRTLPVPKVMSYRSADGADQKFVRPAHGLLALHGGEIVAVTALGLTAGRTTQGHRFLGARNLEVLEAQTWEKTLASRGKVIASFGKRRARIEKQLRQTAASLEASLGPALEFTALLDEVSALVEHPAVYAGEFDAEFLSVPQECLVLTLRAHQKYFPLFDPSGKLVNRFLIVSNMPLKDPRNIIEGNQRVVRPRLADARFFFETDQKTRFAERVPQLATVVYHGKLGSQLERVERIRTLAVEVAVTLGADSAFTERAAWLAKADLGTLMVGEFPELQGVMGRYYAQLEEAPEVAQAIREHYLPRSAGDALPETGAGIALAIADKLDTLAGIFALGQKPTGTRDPFGLRRAAIGVLRILIERQLPLDLRTLIDRATALQPVHAGQTAEEVYDYIMERLRAYYLDGGGAAANGTVTVEMLDAVLATRVRSPLDFDARLKALAAFLELPEAASLTAANKRIANILRKSATPARAEVIVADLRNDAEIRLFDTMRALSEAVSGATARREYAAALGHLAQLRPAVDAFFEHVMVMDPDADLRANRLALLAQLHGLFSGVADLSRLPG